MVNGVLALRALGQAMAQKEPDIAWKKPDIAWRCGKTIVGWTQEDSGYSSGSSGINDDDLAIIVLNPPPKKFVLKFHTTAHAYSTWAAETDGKPCDREHNFMDKLSEYDEEDGCEDPEAEACKEGD
jgi:hypothetical protein